MNNDSEPTVTTEYGEQRWLDEDGKLHRDGDLPAVISADGTQRSWFRHGKLHRDDDQPAFILEPTPNACVCLIGGIIPARHEKEWWVNGVRHRDGNKPAYISTTWTRWWYQYGVMHRENGPAFIRVDGSGAQYWLHGVRVNGKFVREATRLGKKDPDVAALFLTMYQNGWTGTAVQLRNAVQAIFAPTPGGEPYESTAAGQYLLFAS